MSQGTLYYCTEAGEPLRTRAILPYHLVKHYKLDVKLGEPDEHYPSEYPARLVPAYRYANGRTLTESVPIALLLTSYIPNNGNLLGDNSAADEAQILAWLNVLNIELMDNIATQFTMLVGRQPYNKAKYENAVANTDRAVKNLEAHLTKNTYLVGEKVSLADLYGIPMLLRALQKLWGPEYRKNIPAVLRWYNTVSKNPVYAGFFDSVELTETSQKPAEHK